MTDEMPQIEPGLLYTPETLPDACRYILTSREPLQYGLPSYHVTTTSRWITPKMGRIYATDYVLVPWEDRFIEEHNIIKEFQGRSPEVISVFPEAPGVQQLVLAEFFEDDSFMEPPHMVLRGYVFLFWAEFLPNIPDYNPIPLQQWIDENDVYSIIERQVTSHRNRDYLVQKRSKADASQSDSKDAEPSEEIPF